MFGRLLFGLVLTFLGMGSPSLWASGQAEAAPVIQMDAQPRQYLAPQDPTAKNQTLVLPFSSLTFTAKGQVIKSWTFSVFDSSGHLVSEESRLETRSRGFFGDLFNLGPRPQVEIPKELTWDGRYHGAKNPQDGMFVPDGNYTYQITVVDSAGGRAQTPPFNATIKNAKVAVYFIRVAQPIFAPLGNRPTVSIEQSGSHESHWEGRFIDSAGRIVRTYLWENTSESVADDLAPPPFSWDGRDDSGTVVPDGVYFYSLTGRNRAGASASTTLTQALTVSERSGIPVLSSETTQFSPKAVGAPTSILFKPEVEIQEGLTQWRVTVSDATNPTLARWTRSGPAPVPKEIEFAGNTTSGLPLPEGHYAATLTISYDNGNTGVSNPFSFDLVLTPPQAVLSASAMVFGGTGRAGITVDLKGEPGIPWGLDVLTTKGQLLRHYDLGDSGNGSVEFQGLDEQGKPLPDGTLVLQASAKNRAGVLGFTRISVRKDNRPMKVGLDLSRTVVVPNRGQAGIVRVTPVLSVADSIDKTVYKVTGSNGTVVANRQAESLLTFWDWDGSGTDTRPVPDGAYRVAVEVTYANGTVSRASSDVTVDSKFLDTTAPNADIHLSSLVFAPKNVDGPQFLTIDLKAKEGASPLASWSLQILDPRGKGFRLFSGNGSPPAHVVWDGKSDSGDYVESGEQYEVIFEVDDTAGRQGSKQDVVTVDILVDKLADGRYKIVINSIQFSGYSSDVFKLPQALLSKNVFVLQRLASVLNRLPGYKIGLEGYAVSEFSTDAKTSEWEQTTQLLPLSQDRAQEVKMALVLLGVDDARFTVQGFGALRPLVPNTDLENRWKNRRVEFYLEKSK